MSILSSISQSNPRGAAHACSGYSFRGGVSPRFTRLRGQGIIEYVLIIAIIVLVILIVGPWVSSAIRNQFNLVAGTLGNGINKGSWESDGTGAGGGSLTDTDIADPENGTAFAVYSEDDHSLLFYKRRGVPQVGDMFNDRMVTQVYTGFEDYRYGLSVEGDWQSPYTTPWYAYRDSISSVKVVDDGIEPANTRFWFGRLSKVISIDL